MGGGQERDVERVEVIVTASVRFNTRSGPREGTVGLMCFVFASTSSLNIPLPSRWFCEPAYEKLRGTEEGIVNRLAAFTCKTMRCPNTPYPAGSIAKRHTSCQEGLYGEHLSCPRAAWNQKSNGCTTRTANCVKSSATRVL